MRDYCTYDLTQSFLFKIISACNEANRNLRWRKFVNAITITDVTARQPYKTRQPLRNLGPKLPWGTRLNRTHKLGEEPVSRQAEKNLKSKSTSCTYADPLHRYYPNVFAWGNSDNIESILGGVRLPKKDKTVRMRKIKRNDTCTYACNDRFPNSEITEIHLEMAIENEEEFSDERELVNIGISNDYNEVLAELRWDFEDPACQVIICDDTKLGRFEHIRRARDLERRLKAMCHEEKKECPKDYRVPISFYINKPTINLSYYTQAMQEEDLNFPASNKYEQYYISYLQLEAENFECKNINEFKTDELEAFIRFADNSSYETGLLFYNNFFLNNSAEMINQLAIKGKSSLLSEIFMLVSPEEREIAVLDWIENFPDREQLPKLRSFYLHSLLSKHCLKRDEDELEHLLSHTDSWEFDLNVKDSNEETLYEAAIQSHLFSIADKLREIAKKKDSDIFSTFSKDSIRHALVLAMKKNDLPSTQKCIALDQKCVLYQNQRTKDTALHWAAFLVFPSILSAIIEQLPLSKYSSYYTYLNNDDDSFYTLLIQKLLWLYSRRFYIKMQEIISLVPSVIEYMGDRNAEIILLKKLSMIILSLKETDYAKDYKWLYLFADRNFDYYQSLDHTLIAKYLSYPFIKINHIQEDILGQPLARTLDILFAAEIKLTEGLWEQIKDDQWIPEEEQALLTYLKEQADYFNNPSRLALYEAINVERIAKIEEIFQQDSSILVTPLSGKSTPLVVAGRQRKMKVLTYLLQKRIDFTSLIEFLTHTDFLPGRYKISIPPNAICEIFDLITHHYPSARNEWAIKPILKKQLQQSFIWACQKKRSYALVSLLAFEPLLLMYPDGEFLNISKNIDDYAGFKTILIETIRNSAYQFVPILIKHVPRASLTKLINSGDRELPYPTTLKEHLTESIKKNDIEVIISITDLYPDILRQSLISGENIFPIAFAIIQQRFAAAMQLLCAENKNSDQLLAFKQRVRWSEEKYAMGLYRLMPPESPTQLIYQYVAEEDNVKMFRISHRALQAVGFFTEIAPEKSTSSIITFLKKKSLC